VGVFFGGGGGWVWVCFGCVFVRAVGFGFVGGCMMVGVFDLFGGWVGCCVDWVGWFRGFFSC
ncbi:hypothetical protein, partial [Escherichia coli]|uniref:hypothetical protein n=1 Tax=Escherichia coli TaxID=562 RepID=UPI003D35A906